MTEGFGELGRRAVLFGGLAATAAALGACSSHDVPTAPPSPAGSSPAKVTTAVSGSFFSRYRHAETGWTILYPPGVRREGLPVLVALHGRGGNHTSIYSELHLDRYLATVVAAGSRPFAIAAADGGEHDYWHPRVHTNPAGMIVHEFIPLLARHGLATGKVGLMGWSMGGYGALYLATVLRAPRVSAVIAESPAIWRHSYQVVGGSFDGPADFRHHALWHRLNRLRGIPLWISCGASDGFAPITRQLRHEVSPPRPAGGFEPGGHGTDYWRREAEPELRWFARQLA